MTLKLTVISLNDEQAPQTVTLDKREITIGRADKCDLTLPSSSVSEVHAKLVVRRNDRGEHKIYICDLGSTNGTSIGSKRLGIHQKVEVPADEQLVIADFLIKPEYIYEDKLEVEAKGESRVGKSAFPAMTQVVNGPAIVEAEVIIDNDDIGERDESWVPLSKVEEKDKQKAEVKSLVDHMKNLAELEEELDHLTDIADEISKEEQKLTDNKEGIEPLPNDESNDEIELTIVDDEVAEHEIAIELPAAEEPINESRVKLRGEDDDELEAKDKVKDLNEEEAPLLNSADKNSDAEIPTKVVIDPKPATVSGVVGSENVEGLNFTLTKLHKLTGKVIHKGAPLTGVEINAGDLGIVVTDESGIFRFTNVREQSKLEVTATKKKFIFEYQNLPELLSGNDEITVIATELFHVSGIIEHNGEPLAGVEIDGGDLGKTITDEKGHYIFKDVPEGTEFSVTASLDGYLVETAS